MTTLSHLRKSLKKCWDTTTPKLVSESHSKWCQKVTKWSPKAVRPPTKFWGHIISMNIPSSRRGRIFKEIQLYYASISHTKLRSYACESYRKNNVNLSLNQQKSAMYMKTIENSQFWRLWRDWVEKTPYFWEDLLLQTYLELTRWC